MGIKVGPRVLHIWNTGGIAGRLAEYMYKNHYTEKTKVLFRRKQDPSSLATSRVQFIGGGPIWFLIKVFYISLKYPVLHFHSLDKWLGFYKRIFANKLIIIHYHGSDIRGKWEEKRELWRHADKIIVSTPDLLEGAPDRAEHIPNLVNVDPIRARANTAFHREYDALDLASRFAEERGLEFNPVSTKRRIPHDEFLKMIARHEYYIDVRRKDGELLRCLSSTGIEALALGVKVINWEGQVIEELPEIYDPRRIAERYLWIYEEWPR